MGSGASSQPHADAYDSLKLIAASEAQGSAPKPKAKEGPELKTVLDVSTRVDMASLGVHIHVRPLLD